MVKTGHSHNKGKEHYSLDVFSDLHQDKPNGHNPLPGVEEVNPKTKTSYKFRKSLNRIVIRSQISPLFDKESHCRKTQMRSVSERYHTDTYAGKIGGIDTRIEFQNDAPCYIYAKTLEDFYKVYHIAVNRTIERGN